MDLLGNVQSRRMAKDRGPTPDHLVLLGVHFAAFVAVAFLIHFGILALHRRFGFNLRHLHLASFLVVLCIVVPFIIFVSSILFGAILANMESWTFTVGMNYCFSNALGLVVPLTDQVPETIQGKVIAFVLSTWVYVMCSATIALVSVTSFSRALAQLSFPTRQGFLRSTLIYIPIVVLLIAVPGGAVHCLFEAWSFADGYFFMISQILGLANPLTQKVPHSVNGKTFQIMCTSIDLCLSGTILGIISNHPFLQNVATGLESFRVHHVVKKIRDSLRSIEGDADKDSSQATSEMNHEDVACSKSDSTLSHQEYFEKACQTEEPVDSLNTQDWTALRCREEKLRLELEQIRMVLNVKDGAVSSV